jgi:hypothetical protein
VNAPAAPGRSNFPPKQPSHLIARAILRQVLCNESLEQVLDPISHDAASRFALLRGRITSFQLYGKDLLCR